MCKGGGERRAASAPEATTTGALQFVWCCFFFLQLWHTQFNFKLKNFFRVNLSYTHTHIHSCTNTRNFDIEQLSVRAALRACVCVWFCFPISLLLYCCCCCCCCCSCRREKTTLVRFSHTFSYFVFRFWRKLSLLLPFAIIIVVGHCCCRAGIFWSLLRSASEKSHRKSRGTAASSSTATSPSPSSSSSSSGIGHRHRQHPHESVIATAVRFPLFRRALVGPGAEGGNRIMRPSFPSNIIRFSFYSDSHRRTSTWTRVVIFT